MKKASFYLFALLLSSTLAISCNEYHSLNSATKVSQLSGNPFLYNVSKSLMKNTLNFLAEKGIKGTMKKFNLLTPLTSIITNGNDMEAFKSMIGNAYKIPTKKLVDFSSLGNMKDLVSFVAKNGQSFNFYK